MRLTQTEQQTFITVLAKYVKPSAQLRLFGSRIDDTAKGGDVDLLLILPDPQNQHHLLFYKGDILAEIKTVIGEQKIDLIITTQQGIDNSAFLQSIYPSSVLLNTF